jgi:septum formation protein
MGSPCLVLASNSPRRRDLLALGGWKFRVQPCEVEESLKAHEKPQAYVLRLAASKAHCCADALEESGGSAPAGTFILSADTTVADGKVILGKPDSTLDAIAMLQRLKGRTHQVYTAIAVMEPAGRKLLTDLCVTLVPMRNYGQDEIEVYVASGDPFDKAGGYAIQHPQFHPVVEFSGCFASVMGLPLCHLTRTLRKFNILPQGDPAHGCQSGLNYTCLISMAVINGENVG